MCRGPFYSAVNRQWGLCSPCGGGAGSGRTAAQEHAAETSSESTADGQNTTTPVFPGPERPTPRPPQIPQACSFGRWAASVRSGVPNTTVIEELGGQPLIKQNPPRLNISGMGAGGRGRRASAVDDHQHSQSLSGAATRSRCP